MKNPKITLVGAGPGDPDLITIKGMKALQSADVVLYDALANEELLAYTSDACLKIFVGKRADKPLAMVKARQRFLGPDIPDVLWHVRLRKSAPDVGSIVERL